MLRTFPTTVGALLDVRARIKQTGVVLYGVWDPRLGQWAYWGRTGRLNERICDHWCDPDSRLGQLLRADDRALTWPLTFAYLHDFLPLIEKNLLAMVPAEYARTVELMAALNAPEGWIEHAPTMEWAVIAVLNPWINEMCRRWLAGDRLDNQTAFLDEFLERVNALPPPQVAHPEQVHRCWGFPLAVIEGVRGGRVQVTQNGKTRRISQKEYEKRAARYGVVSTTLEAPSAKGATLTRDRLNSTGESSEG